MQYYTKKDATLKLRRGNIFDVRQKIFVVALPFLVILSLYINLILRSKSIYPLYLCF